MTVVGVWHVSVRVVVTAGDSDVGLAIWDDRQRQQTIAAAGAAGTGLPTPGCRHWLPAASREWRKAGWQKAPGATSPTQALINRLYPYTFKYPQRLRSVDGVGGAVPDTRRRQHAAPAPPRNCNPSATPGACHHPLLMTLTSLSRGREGARPAAASECAERYRRRRRRHRCLQFTKIDLPLPPLTLLFVTPALV